MKNLLALLGLMLTVSIFGQNSLLWKVSGNGLEKPSYLFGTIHAICEQDFFLPEKVERTFSESQKLFLEIDLSDPNVVMQVQLGMVDAKRQNLKRFLDEGETKALDILLQEKMGASVDQLGVMKPWALASLLSVKEVVDCDQPASYEMKFIEMAKSAQKMVGGLETVSDQIGLFDIVSIEKQMDWLRSVVEDKGEMGVLYNQLLSAYKKQEVKKVYDLILEQEEMIDFADLLLDQRNITWIPKIQQAMQERSCFFAFGCGHLGGENGVLNLLRKEGYVVEAVE